MIRTRRNRKIKIDHVAIAYHRNGVGGAGFHQVGFSWKDQEGIELWMVGLVFEAERHVVVMNLDDADQQWRGDTFEAVLRAARGADRKLIERAAVFDVFAGAKAAEQFGAGRKSVAISVRLQPTEGTLTEAEIEAVSSRVVAAVVKATGATLRA